MSKETIAEKVLRRISNQAIPQTRVEGMAVVFDETILPAMEMTSDWTISGTSQWSRRELGLLQSSSVKDLGKILSKAGSWVLMAGVSELLMHGEEERAKTVAIEAVRREPGNIRTFNHYFGEEITADLLRKPTTH